MSDGAPKSSTDQTEQPEDRAASAQGRHGSLVKRLLAASLVLIIVLALAVFFGGPRVAGAIAKERIESALGEAIAGEVSIARVDLSWTGPQRVSGIEVREAEGGGSVASIGSVSVPRSLLALAGEPSDLGELTLRDVRASVEVSERGSSNVRAAFAPSEEVIREREAERAKPAAAAEPAEMPLVPSALRVRLVIEGPVVIDYRTPEGSGELRVNFESETITARGPAVLKLNTVERGAPQAGGADEDYELAATLRLESLAGADGRLDIASALGGLSIDSDGAPPAVARLIAALTGADATGGQEPLAFSVGVTVRDGRLRLTDPARGAYLNVPLTDDLLAGLIGPGGGGLAVEPGGAVRLTISELNVPVAGIVSELLGLPRLNAGADLSNAAFAGELSVPALSGELRTPGVDAGARTFSSDRSTVVVQTDRLAEGVRVRGGLGLAIDGAEPASVSVDALITGLIAEDGGLADVRGAGARGELVVDRFLLAAVQPFVADAGVDLVEMLGERASLRVDATAERTDAPVRFEIQGSATNGGEIEGVAWLHNGSLRSASPDGAEAGRLSMSTPAPGLVAAAFADRLGATPGAFGSGGRAVISVESFAVPLLAPQPLTQASADVRLNVDGMGIGGTVINSALRADVRSGEVVLSGASPDAPLFRAEDAAALAGVFAGGSREIALGGDGLTARLGSGPAEVTLAGSGVSLDLRADDPLTTLRGAVQLTAASGLEVIGAGARYSVPGLTLSASVDEASGPVGVRIASANVAGTTDRDIDLDLRWPALAGEGGLTAGEALIPTVSGFVRNVPAALAGVYLDEQSAPALRVLGERLDLSLSRTALGGRDATSVRLTTSAGSEANALVLANAGTVEVRRASAELRAEPIPVASAIRALTDADPPAALRSAAVLGVDVSDFTFDIERGELRAFAGEQINIVLSGREPIGLALADSDRVVQFVGLSVSAAIDGANAVDVNGSVVLSDPLAGSDGGGEGRLGELVLSGRVDERGPRGMMELTGAESAAIDRWWFAGDGARSGEQPISTLLGERFALTLGTSLGATGGADGGLVVRLDAERVQIAAEFDAVLDAGGEVMAYELARPVRTGSLTVTPALFSALAPAPEGAARRLTLGGDAPVSFEIAALTLGPLADPFAADVFLIDARAEATGVVFAAEPVSPEGLEENDAPLPEPVRLARFEASLSRAAESTGGALADASLAARFAAFDRQGGRRFGGEANIAGFGTDDASIDASITGRLPTWLIDAAAGLDSALTLLVGDAADVDIRVSDARLDGAAGTVSGSFDTERSNALLAGTFQDGALDLGVTQSGAPSAITLSTFDDEFSRRVLGVLFPALDSFEKTRDDEPLVLSVRPRREGERSGLRVPLGGDLARLNGAVTLDMGTVTFSAADVLGEVLARTQNNVQGMIGGNIEPITIVFADGVARYDNFVIPWGEVKLQSSATVDLVAREMDVVLFVPVDELSEGAERALGRVPGARNLARVPLRAKGPIGRARFAIAPELITDELRRTLERNAQDALEEIINRGLDDLFKR